MDQLKIRKKIRAVIVIRYITLLYLAFVCVLFEFFHTLLINMGGIFIALIFLGIIVLFFAWQFSVCPRCDQLLFYMVGRDFLTNRFMNPFSNKCLHCELPLTLDD